MIIPIYQIDAFSQRAFEGNPAAICPLKSWLPDETLLAIAEENNLSETAFFIKNNGDFHIRWFTPQTEVDLCGHATLAAAYVIFELLDYTENTVCFDSKSGVLSVTKRGDLLEMDFPSQPPELCELPDVIRQAINIKPLHIFAAEDYLVEVNSEAEVLALMPQLDLLKGIDRRGVIVTAQSDQYDFVSRFFAPKYGIDEDPVTGSAHTQLAPYWAKKLKKSSLHAKQLSKRGGELFCEIVGDRVMIKGYAKKYLQGEIDIDI